MPTPPLRSSLSRVRVTPPFTALADQEVFAVDERSAQLVVRSATDTISVDIAGQHLVAETTRGAAVVSVEHLEANAAYTAVLSDGSGRSLGELDVQTAPSLGPVLSRFATISDVHLGAAAFGPARAITDDHDEPYALRCGRSALLEAAQWGAEVLLVKGDLTDTGATSDWDQATQMFADTPIPFLFTPGNHDQWKTRELDPTEGSKLLGVPSDRVQRHDLVGVRLLLGDTSKPDRGTGDMSQLRDELMSDVAVDTPVFLGLHHNIQRAPFTWFWPPGTPSTNAMPVVTDLAAVNPSLFISSGHTHRNRRHTLGLSARQGPSSRQGAQHVVYTEVGSTADYPGVWAGYEVTESAIRQTVRRIASPEAIGWTEATRAAIGGVWPRWSQGRLDDRCVDAVFGR